MAARTSSRVHSKYQTKSSVKNWSEYEQVQDNACRRKV